MKVSRGGRPGLPSLISLTVSVDVKQHFNNGEKARKQLGDTTGLKLTQPRLNMATPMLPVTAREKVTNCLPQLFLFPATPPPPFDPPP